MLKNDIKELEEDKYNITVYDHVNNQVARIHLTEFITKLNCNLSKFDSVVMSYSAYEILRTYKQFKPAKSMVIVKAEVGDKQRILNFSDSSSLNCKFAIADENHGFFLDKFAVTVNINKDEAEKLDNYLFKEVKKQRGVSYHREFNKAVQFKKVYRICSSKCGDIFVLIYPVNSKNNGLKIVYNPCNVSNKALYRLLRELNKVCRDSLIDKLNNSNITVFHLATDSDGYLVDDVHLNLANATYAKQFVSANGATESKVIGISKAISIIVYNKALESSSHEL
jgi:hypothetical protein